MGSVRDATPRMNSGRKLRWLLSPHEIGYNIRGTVPFALRVVGIIEKELGQTLGTTERVVPQSNGTILVTFKEGLTVTYWYNGATLLVEARLNRLPPPTPEQVAERKRRSHRRWAKYGQPRMCPEVKRA
jgi:hypothetical protein